MAGFEEFAGDSKTPSDFHRVLTVQPLNRSGGSSEHAVELTGWPSEIGAIDLVKRTDLEEETVTEILEILKSEFE